MVNFTPISNILIHDLNLLNQYAIEFIKIRPINMSSLELHKHKLGKQSYTKIIGFSRCWVWETDSWIAYVSKRGLSFEVIDTLSPTEAMNVWHNYCHKMTT